MAEDDGSKSGGRTWRVKFMNLFPFPLPLFPPTFLFSPRVKFYESIETTEFDGSSNFAQLEVG